MTDVQALARAVRRRLAAARPRFRAVVRSLAALPFVGLIRLIRPFRVIRVQPLLSGPIGHLAANTEIYLCETLAGIDVPAKPFIDICYFDSPRVGNGELARMWRRVVRIWPRRLMEPIHELNQRLPGGTVHTAGSLIRHNRDIHNVLERFPPSLSFTGAERGRGEAGLRELGIPEGAQFVCIAARDGAFHRRMAPDRDSSYHDYRNVDIANFAEAAEALADRGFYVVRVGSVVEKPLPSANPMVIDYATSRCRSEFLDIYLGAKCLFCLTVGTGIDSIPMIFRRPLAFVNFSSVAHFPTYVPGGLFLAKRHRSRDDGRWLSLTEVFFTGAAHCLTAACYRDAGVELVENTPAEIREVALEALDRALGTWRPEPIDDELQRRFWQLYPLDTTDQFEGLPLHGQVRARHSAHFLRSNPWWLQ